MKRNASILLAAAALSAGIIASTSPAQAGGYPTNSCVSKKMKAAGKFCQATLQAWSMWHADPTADPGGTARDASITAAAGSLTAAWEKAEASAAKKSSDCVETTATATQITTDIGTAIDALQATLGASVDAADQTCRAKALGAAAKLCSGSSQGELEVHQGSGERSPEDDAGGQRHEGQHVLHLELRRERRYVHDACAAFRHRFGERRRFARLDRRGHDHLAECPDRLHPSDPG